MFSYASKFDSGNYPLKLSFADARDPSELQKVIRDLHLVNRSLGENGASPDAESQMLNGVFHSVQKETRAEVLRLKSELLDAVQRERELKKRVDALERDLEAERKKNTALRAKKAPPKWAKPRRKAKPGKSLLSRGSSKKSGRKAKKPLARRSAKKRGILGRSSAKSVKSKASRTSRVSRGSRGTSRKSGASRRSSPKNSRFWNTSYIERQSRNSVSVQSAKKRGIGRGKSGRAGSRKSGKSRRSGASSGKSEFKTRKKKRGQSEASSADSLGWSEDSFELKQRKFRNLKKGGVSEKERNKIARLNAKMLNLKLRRNRLKAHN